MSTIPIIQFHFDFLSPYAFLAWHRLPVVVGNRATIHAVPTLLAALLGAHGTKGPAEVPAKRTYVFKDVVRHAHALKIPLTPPPSHPFNPLLSLRAVSIVDDEERKHAFITALFAVAWGGVRHDEGGLESPAVVERCANAVGLNGADLVAHASSPDAKTRLKTQSDDAVTAGVFGVPSMVIAGELFWGLDSLAHVSRHLDGDEPVTDALIASWRDLPASATRQ